MIKSNFVYRISGNSDNRTPSVATQTEEEAKMEAKGMSEWFMAKVWVYYPHNDQLLALFDKGIQLN